MKRGTSSIHDVGVMELQCDFGIPSNGRRKINSKERCDRKWKREVGTARGVCRLFKDGVKCTRDEMAPNVVQSRENFPISLAVPCQDRKENVQRA